MKNRLTAYASVALVAGILYGVSLNSSQAQPNVEAGRRLKTGQVPHGAPLRDRGPLPDIPAFPTPDPNAPSQLSPTPTPVVLKPDTLASWMKHKYTDTLQRVVNTPQGSKVERYQRTNPWGPLRTLKFELKQAPPVKTWMTPKPEDAYDSFVLEMTAPDLPGVSPKAEDYDAEHPGWKHLGSLNAFTDFEVLEAYMRPLPDEPWIAIDLKNEDLMREYYFSTSSSNIWMQRGKVIRYEDSIRARSGGEWRMKVRVRASLEKVLTYFPTPVWGIEKTFWVQIQMPHDSYEGVQYPAALHSSWVAGFSYAPTRQGPWKPIPKRSEKGFPLTWSKQDELYVRAEKKHPAERWPTDTLIAPTIYRGKTELSEAGMFDVYGNNHYFTSLNEYPRLAVLRPKLRLDVKQGGEFLTVKTTAGNTETASIFVSDKKTHLPENFDSWDDVQRAVVDFKIDGRPISTTDGVAYHKAKRPNEPATLNIRTHSKAYYTDGKERDVSEFTRLTLRDSQGKLLVPERSQDTGEYNFTIAFAGKYVLSIDVIGRDGKPMYRRASLRNDPRFTSDLSQKLDIIVEEPKWVNTNRASVTVEYGEWTPAKEANVWQRSITASSRSTLPSTYSFKIVPLGGLRPNPRVSWLRSSQGQLLGSRFQNSLHNTQYYRAISPLPEGASRQTAVYEVVVTARELDSSGLNFEGGLR